MGGSLETKAKIMHTRVFLIIINEYKSWTEKKIGRKNWTHLKCGVVGRGRRALWIPWTSETQTRGSSSKLSLTHGGKSDQPEAVLHREHHEKPESFGDGNNAGKKRRQQEKRKTKHGTPKKKR